ncbi:hypothetical protein MIMGU_mgv1a019836mg, partial [Erythranthe guttata]
KANSIEEYMANNVCGVVQLVVDKLGFEKSRSFKGVSASTVENLSQDLIVSLRLVASAEAKHFTNDDQFRHFRDFLFYFSKDLDDYIELVKSGLEHVNPINILESKLETFISKITDSLTLVRQSPLLDQGSQSRPEEEETFLFGPPEKEIRELLLQESIEFPVISFHGMGGMGKTTLAGALYNDAGVRRSFQAFAWVNCARKEFYAITVVKSILGQLLPRQKKVVAGLSFLDSTRMLYRLQQKVKCLIVICDVRTRENWRNMRVAFPIRDETRTQILITTRIEEVAADCRQNGKLYGMRQLDADRSNRLFNKIAGGTTNLIPHCVDKLRKEILSRCGGSPLAITIAAGYWNSITNKDDTTFDPNKAFDEINLHQDETADPERSLRSMLQLCYSNLPLRLKACFLYLAQLTRSDRSEIRVDEIYLRWIAEGLVVISEDESANTTKTDITENYLLELARRNMVRLNGEELVKSCQIHPLVRDFCVDQGEKEKLFEVVAGRGFATAVIPKSLASGLTIEMNAYCEDRAAVPAVVPHGGGNSRCSSLYFMDTVEPVVDYAAADWRRVEVFEVKEFMKRVLRVVEFDGVDFRLWKLPKGMGNLVFLRYLSFRRCHLEEIPSSLGNLSELRILDLRVRGHCRVTIPDLLCKFAKIERLYFPAKYRSGADHGRLNMRGLTEVEILVNFDTKVCYTDHLEDMKKLQRFDVVVEDDHKALDKVVDFVDDVVSTTSFSLDVRNFTCYSDERISVLRKMLVCESLRKLQLEGHIKKFPDNVVGIMLANVEEIVLDGSELKVDPMQRLGKLSKLKSLDMRNDAFIGKEMVCHGSDFPNLKSFKLVNFHYLEKWTVEPEAMPKVSTMWIEKCSKLSSTPAGRFEFAHNINNELNIVC